MYFPQKIVENATDRLYLSKIYTIAIYAKSILSVVSIGMFFAIIYFSGYLDTHLLFFLIYSFAIIGNAFLPIWHYQGLERLYKLTSGMILTKACALGLIFVLVRDRNDFTYIALINALQILILSGIYNAQIVISGIRIAQVSWAEIKKAFANSLSYFLSRAAVSLYTTCCGIYLGVFSSPGQVAIYNVAEQLYRAGTQVFAPVSQAVYPYMIRTKNFKFYYKIITLTVLVALCGALFGWFLGDSIITLIFGAQYKAASDILKIFMITIVFSTAGVMFGYPLLVPLGKAKLANQSVYFAGIVQVLGLVYIFVTSTNITASSVAISVLLCELTVLLLRVYAFARKK